MLTRPTSIAVISVAVPILVAACGSSAAAPSAATTGSCPDTEIVVAASDYASSVVCGAPGCALGEHTSGVDLGRDPQLTSSNGRTFFLARDFDLVFELDPKCGTPIARFSVNELATGAAANPHDVAVARDGSLLVALYNVPKIARVKDGKVIGSIDLSASDADGNPQIESIRVVGDKAFVALERLDDRDRLLSKQSSQMLRIDVATGAIEETVELAGRNPFNPMKEAPGTGALFLAEPGNFDAADEALAGIERFDTTTMATRLLVPEKALGASVTEVAVADGCGAVIVAEPVADKHPTSLATFDPVTGQVLARAILGPTPGFDLQALAWRNGKLYVGDRRAASPAYRVHVFEKTDACTLHETRTIDLPRPPVAIRASTSERSERGARSE